MKYLEKIVQYDIDLPYPSQSGIFSLFGERVDPTIEIPGGKKWDKDRWSKLYNGYLRHLIKTPRQAIRLSNAFNIAYPVLRGEIDPVDFLAIESLRMFHPKIFYEIRRNSDHYTELGQNELDPNKTDPVYFERVLNLVMENDRDTIKHCLELLFPRVKNAFSNIKSSTNEIHNWRAQARVCSSNHFGRYFSYSILPQQFSEAEILDAIKLSADIIQFEKLIIDYSKQISKSGKSRIPDFLERLLDFVKAGQVDDYIHGIITNFLILGDLIVRDEDEDRSSFLRIETDMRILWIINAALQRMSEGNVFDLVKNAFQKTKSVHIPLRLQTYFGKEHGLYGQKEKESLRSGKDPYLTTDQIKKLEKIVLSKVRAASKNNSLLENPDLPSILYRWKDIIGNFNEQKLWAKKITSSDDNLRKFLVHFAGVSVISNMEGSTEKIYVRADNIADFLDLDKTEARVKMFSNNTNLSDTEKIVFESFIQSCEDKRSGKSSRH